MKLAICDDDIRILTELEKMVSGLDCSGVSEMRVCSSADQLVEACRETAFDLVFLDIMLGEDSGIAAAKEITALLPDVRVVFITAHLPDFAEKIFMGVRPYGYIGKPVDSSMVKMYIDRAMEELNQQARFLTVRSKGVEYQFSLSAVWYIESSGRKALIHCGDEVMIVYDRLDNLWTQLDGRFVRCHQSFIVNLDRVTELRDEGLVIGNGSNRTVIRVSRNRAHDTRQKYFEHKGRTLI